MNRFRVVFRSCNSRRWLRLDVFISEDAAYVAWGRLRKLGYRAEVIWA